MRPTSMNWLRSIPNKNYLFLSFALILISGVVLYFMGQVIICKCGYVKFWHGEVFSSGNSQHLTDWYTFTHIIHGFVFYFLFWAIFRKRLPVAALLAGAVAVEAAWEIFENTDLVINRYREVTISLDYFGDSVINSLTDQLAMVAGFLLAWRLPVAMTIVLALLLEGFLGYNIRDNFVLNIIMLVYPLDSIREWQSSLGG